MSRVAKAPVSIPKETKVYLENFLFSATGKNGKLEQRIREDIRVSIEENTIVVAPKIESKHGWMMAGTTRSLINNMVIGVSEGFEKKLELIGVGYRAQVSGKKLNLSLGFSHPVEYQLPEDVTAETQGNTVIVLKSISKQRVGQAAAEIRAFRPPEPYKGKGVRYSDEVVIRKETKKK